MALGGLLAAGALGAGVSSAFGLYSQSQAEKNQGHYLAKQQAFNAEQAQIGRDWAQHMDNTKVRRRVRDMRKAGINPILAVGSGYSSAAPSSPTATSSLQNENSVNSGLTAMQSYSTMFKSITSSIADIIKASKDKQTINIKQPASDVAEDFKGGLEAIAERFFNKGGKIADKAGIPKAVQNIVAAPFSNNSAKTYEASYNRLNTVYKSMQKLRGLPKSSYSKSNFQKVANTIIRDRSLKLGQKGILLKRLRTIWSTGQ